MPCDTTQWIYSIQKFDVHTDGVWEGLDTVTAGLDGIFLSGWRDSMQA